MQNENGNNLRFKQKPARRVLLDTFKHTAG
jgi:hypothetical protein